MARKISLARNLLSGHMNPHSNRINMEVQLTYDIMSLKLYIEEYICPITMDSCTMS